MFTRRRFLIHASQLAALATLPACHSLDAFITGEKKEDDHVAIIGGGASGLMAALTLRKAGIPFKLYDASGSLGGRMQTVSFLTDSGFTAELGAEWFSRDDEIVISLAKELGLELVSVPLKESSLRWNFDSAKDSFASGIREIHSKVRNQVRFNDEIQSVADWSAKTTNDSALLDYLDSYCSWRYGAAAGEVLAFPLLSEWSRAADAFDLFVQKQIKFRNGTQNLVAAMLERVGGAFPAEVVELESRLTAIRSKSSHLQLTMRSGSKESKLAVRAVLIALPLSQIATIDGYQQILPPAIGGSLTSVKRMGTQSKSVYAFPIHPWKIQRSIGKMSQIFESSFELSPIMKAPGGVLSMTRLDGKTSGTAEEELSSLFPGGSLPSEIAKKTPDYVQNWSTKALINGSHSFPAVETPWDWNAFETDQIFWAGEHTAGEKQGTLAGALTAGQAAANRLIARLVKRKS